jgi:hypothetical protein
MENLFKNWVHRQTLWTLTSRETSINHKSYFARILPVLQEDKPKKETSVFAIWKTKWMEIADIGNASVSPAFVSAGWVS